MDRRHFLKTSSVVSGAALMPRFLGKLMPLDLRNARRLIVVQLSGGNDGLNTFVPLDNDIYHQSRPGIGLQGNEVLKITDGQGFHASLSPLRQLYDEGMMSILNSVGYPNPDRSHFRSMDIWHTGQVDERVPTGWLGRLLDHTCHHCTPHAAIEIGNDLSLAIQGEHLKGMVFDSPEKLDLTMAMPQVQDAISAEYQDGNLGYMHKILVDTRQSAGHLARLESQHLSSPGYPTTDFGRDVKLIADLILAGVESQVYYLSLSSFDTHIRQKGQQRQLLSELATALRALTDDLKRHSKMHDTLILCFSEFGRRVKQNASGGTDHGAGNNVFLIADRLRHPGFFNAPPDLADLDEGDVQYRLDFRQVFAEVLEAWMGVKTADVLGKKFEPLGILG